LHQLIEAYANQGKVVHVIRGEQQEVKRLGDMMNMELPEFQDRIQHPTRRVPLPSCSSLKTTEQ
jgi:hypothetical protein